MQEWEHTVTEVEPHAAAAQQGLQLVERGGERGWQLVAVVPVEGGDRLLMFFRRPKT
jgi:hypothetical protein